MRKIVEKRATNAQKTIEFSSPTRPSPLCHGALPRLPPCSQHPYPARERPPKKATSKRARGREGRFRNQLAHSGLTNSPTSHCKTIPFAMRNHTFWTPKRYLSADESIPFTRQEPMTGGTRDDPPHHDAPHSAHKKMPPANARRHKSIRKNHIVKQRKHSSGHQAKLPAATAEARQGQLSCVFSMLKRGRCLLSMYILPMYSPMMPRLTSTHPKPNHTESITEAHPATTLSVTYSHST